jgi:hypothetical protein
MTKSKTFGMNVQFNYRIGNRTVHDATVLYTEALCFTDAMIHVVRKVQHILTAAGHRDVKVSLVELLDEI